MYTCSIHILLQSFQMKTTTGRSMCQADGDLRLLTTEAYSMGTDAPDIRCVVHAGPPSCLESM